MTIRLALLAMLALFGWAFMRTGALERPSDRQKGKRPEQIEAIRATAQYRLIKQPMGETKVPLVPKRIASLCPAATDSLVALGVRPILVQSGRGLDGPQRYLADRLEGIPTLPRSGAVSLEAVLAAEPDLIFANSMQNGKLYGQLSKIAPTVFIGSMADGLRESRILDVGEVLGMREQAERLLADYHRRLAEARETLASRAKDEPVAFLRFRKDTCVIYTRTDMFGPLLFEQLGLTPDPAMPMVMSGGGWDVLSIERLSKLRAEHIFMTVDPDSELYVQGVSKTPIWQNIPAVRHGHVHRVESSTWLSNGLLGCEAIFADVLKGMASEQTP